MKLARVLLLLCLPLAVACKGKPTEGGASGGGKPGREGLSFAADVMPVEAKKVTYTVNAPGTIEAFERVQVTARVAGVVDRVAFTEGQEVKKGDVLVVIDSERYLLAVNGAKAALAKTEASVRDMEAMVARREGASGMNPGLIPGEELDSYKSKVLTAKADRDIAFQSLRSAQLNLRDSSVRAPMVGAIQTRTVETGQYVQAGYVMATLLQSDPLLLRFQVEPLEAPRLKVGMTATFTMRETLRKFTAKITLIAAAADPTTHMVAVTGEVNDEGHKYWLRPGSFCDVSVDIGAQREAVTIPRLAARATDHGYVAYVVENGVAKERVLALGMSTQDGWVEVRSGLAAGDVLVVRGAEALTDGAKVRPTTITPEALLTATAPSARAQASSAQPPADPASGEPAPSPPPTPSVSASAGVRP
ncbi:efflux RND transporter periplasmic adaptor subunit [Polyangium sorediatum]|uniref:Efflux RND transporter periplasmic adaptor subunit n=1 Tax=Polyangium sorediatum TaxID=889274 RepID=A0ABT6NT81_9BACT|nr:efflux RND transporter periplasmic adaptor subunit [Polyangium sorediatum]MDI1431357.1 efflux RND transporter periplasmic adaptor subunit [Polyangium sorediatum]